MEILKTGIEINLFNEMKIILTSSYYIIPLLVLQGVFFQFGNWDVGLRGPETMNVGHNPDILLRSCVECSADRSEGSSH